MSKEQPQPPNPFGFTEHEKLYDQISDKRFRALLGDEATIVHKAGVDGNNYGEFMFVSLSRKAEGCCSSVTFWGMGYHEYRERWMTDHWRWYQANPLPQALAQKLTYEEVEELLKIRQEEIAPYANQTQTTQTERGKLFEMLADLTDDDGAIAEMDDLGDLWGGLSDEIG